MKHKCYMDNFRELSAFLCIICALVLLTIFLQYHTASFVLNIELEADQSGKLTAFWKKNDESYSAKKSLKSNILQGTTTTITLNLPRPSQIDYITIFPIDKKATLKLRKAVLTYHGHEHTNFLLQNRLAALENQHQVQFVSNGRKITSIQSFEKDSYFEIPISIRSDFIFRYAYLAFGSIFLVVLLFFLLNQRRLKGSKFAGVLLITLPAGELPRIPKMLSNLVGVNSFFRREELGANCIYSLRVMHISQQNVLNLAEFIKESNPDAEVRFQYNRSGEVS